VSEKPATTTKHSFLSDVSLVKLDGTIVKTDGTAYKSNFFKFLELTPDTYDNVSYSPEEARKIRTHLSHLSTGSTAAIPLKCGGEKVCPFASSCPFVKIDQERKSQGITDICTPVGKTCLVELNLLNEWTRLYIYEYNIDENSFTDIQMIRELAEIELMLWRMNNNISKPEHAELIQDVIVGIDKQGTVLTRQEASAIFQIKERLTTRKSKLIKLMVGDRQEKYKREAALKVRETTDPSTSAAKLRSKINVLLKEAERTVIDLKDREGNLIDTTSEEVKTTLSPEDIIDSPQEDVIVDPLD
jgi:hypothetical protein